MIVIVFMVCLLIRVDINTYPAPITNPWYAWVQIIKVLDDCTYTWKSSWFVWWSEYVMHLSIITLRKKEHLSSLECTVNQITLTLKIFKSRMHTLYCYLSNVWKLFNKSFDWGIPLSAFKLACLLPSSRYNMYKIIHKWKNLNREP